MLIKFGPNAICMDATHGTNAYDFNLITAVVIDEFLEGVPVLWAISNKQDTEVLTLVLNIVKQRSGNINPKWFMSDDAQQYFNAWKTVLGGKGCKNYFVLGILIGHGSAHLKIMRLPLITESNSITISWFSCRKEIRFPSELHYNNSLHLQITLNQNLPSISRITIVIE